MNRALVGAGIMGVADAYPTYSVTRQGRKRATFRLLIPKQNVLAETPLAGVYSVRSMATDRIFEIKTNRFGGLIAVFLD